MTDQLSLIEESQSATLANDAYARRTDPWTSHAAARSITEDKLRESQLAVLYLLKRIGASTDEEIADAYSGPPRQSPSGLRTRRKELVDAGYVCDTGDRKRLVSGRLSIVWDAS